MNILKTIVLVFITGFQSVTGQTDGLSKLIKQGAGLEVLTETLSFAEGPASDAKGNIYFTDQPNDRILIWSINDEMTEYMKPSGRANGLCFDRQGNLWACADNKNEIWKITSDKSIIKFSVGYKGVLFNGPNDIWVSSAGNIYFTDPYYKRDYWDHSEMPQEKQCVYLLRKDHKTLIMLIDDLEQPNGIVGSHDGKLLFVADALGGKTYVYTIGPEGILSNKRVFCEQGSDGITIDRKGNIYLTGSRDGVSVYDKTGKKTGNIATGGYTSNVCFGGKNMKTLFITGGKSLYRIKMNVKGNSQ